MYVGSTHKHEKKMFIYDEKTEKIVFKKISFAPGFYKIFDEILVNAADNKQRDKSMKFIKIQIDKETGTISVENDGKPIPIVMHQKENCHVPELIFGHFLAGANFDDNIKKLVGGRNGLGAKLTNVFSKSFVIDVVDAEREKSYHQEWTNNLERKGDAKISISRAKSSTRVTFTPDLERFQMKEIEDDTYALLVKRVYDIAGCNSTLKVSLNGKDLNIKSFQDYCKLYLPDDDENVVYFEDKTSKRWEVVISTNKKTTERDLHQVSFVNSICTTKGGMHVDYLLRQVKTIVDKKLHKRNSKVGANEKLDAKQKIQLADIKPYLWIFVKSLIENPSFDSQSKDSLTTNQKKNLEALANLQRHLKKN